MKSSTKICSACKKEFSIDFFYKRASKCKKCCSEYKKEYIRNNKEKVAEMKKKYHFKNRDIILVRLKLRRSIPENREKSIKNSREWRIKNIERSRNKEFQDHFDRPHIRVLSVIRHRERKHGYAVKIINPEISLKEVMYRHDFTCHICGKPIMSYYAPGNKLAATIDHIIPISKNGDHSWANVAPAHLTCNSKKSDSCLLY